MGRSKAVVGTDGYIAPEAYLGDVCPKSDIFSTGVVPAQGCAGAATIGGWNSVFNIVEASTLTFCESFGC